ncbi:hypothetical protein EG329_014067 [Mollisiaceae sp. DMI_Dod_QoI]|nr:hypothetical protein EG329_014067 [Helotiales sp. DMI_Dod_QoI]
MSPQYYDVPAQELKIRTVHQKEIEILRRTQSDPGNNRFGAMPDKFQPSFNDVYQGTAVDAIAGQIDLFIILPKLLPEHPELHLRAVAYLKEKENDSTMVGYIQICMPADGERASSIGGFIHHPFVRRGYAKEAFRAVIDYAFNYLLREEVVIEAKSINEPFGTLMKSLGLEGMEGPGSYWLTKIPSEESLEWRFGKAKWEEVKRATGWS